jgi:hypothetical protein
MTLALKAIPQNRSKIVLTRGLDPGIGAKLPQGEYFEGNHSDVQQCSI